jgi:signal transduction histidine kinase
MKNGGEHSQELGFRTLKQNIFWGKLIKRSIRIKDTEYIILRISKTVDYLRAEEALSNLLHGTAKVTGHKFFKELTKLICRTFDVKHSFIGKFYENGKYFRVVQSCGPFQGLETEKNLVTGCITENVLKGFTTFYPTGSRDLFPGDDFVAKNCIEGFMGTPVFGNSGEVTGIIAFMNNKPIHEIPNSRYILSIFASRTAAELQRIRSKEILKEQARDLADANIMKDRLLSVISHDLLNPLHSIMGFSGLMHEKAAIYSKKKILERVEIIDNSIKNIFFKLENLSDWSSLSRGKIRIHPEYVALQEVVQQSLSLFQFILRIKNINIRVNLNECPMIYTDGHMLNSIVRNLISNAIKYTPKDGKIAVNYKEKSGKLVLILKDNGFGMPQDDVERISRFETRLSDMRTDRNQHTGLGLILIFAFTKRLGGTVTINSVPEKGTEVLIQLPQSL